MGIRGHRRGIAVLTFALSLPLLAACSAGTREVPTTVSGGAWDAGHVQGVAADLDRGHLYFSFTSLLVKTDLSGRLLGTVEGFTGHLGDLELNPADGKLYGSLEYKDREAFYIAVIDVERVTEPGMDAEDLVRAVYLPEVVDDYVADLNGDGRFDGDVADTPDHRYGTSGIDGVSFGPAFGRTDGRWLLTVAYGIYAATDRDDNDDQVLLQYDTSEWDRLARPLDQDVPHRTGPDQPAGKFFVRTGNTSYGVQNLEYDCASERWLLAAYAGGKPDYPNYTLFAVDAAAAPRAGEVRDGSGMRLQLSADGLRDRTTGIRGWNQEASVGIESLGGGFFYLASRSQASGLEAGDLTLVRWAGDPDRPLDPIGGATQVAGCTPDA